jgi:hypothetical protein
MEGNFGWIIASILNAVTVSAGPMVTPWLNHHAVGSGIIASYFVGTAAISLLVTMLVTGHIQSPEPWVLLAGLLFGAGVLSVQKATERAPEPAVAMAIPSSRAFLTALLAFLVLGFTTTFSLGLTYIVQLILCVSLVAFVHIYNPRNEPTPWSMYAILATILLSLSDIILKYSGSFDTIFGDTSWFAIAGSIIPLVMNYIKTGTFLPTFREKGTVDPVVWWSTLGTMVAVFYFRIITQMLSISFAPNPALPHIIGSLAVPAVAFLAWNTGRYRVTIQETVILVLLAFTSMISGYVASQE